LWHYVDLAFGPSTCGGGGSDRDGWMLEQIVLLPSEMGQFDPFPFLG